MAVDLIVPLKEPSRGKSRLRDGLGCPVSDHRHAELVLAFAFDTLRAATATPGVRRVLVVSSVPAALTALRELGVDVVGEHADDTGDIGNDSDSDDDGDDSDGSDSDDGAPSGRNGAGNGAAGPVGTTDGADAANTGLNAALRTCCCPHRDNASIPTSARGRLGHTRFRVRCRCRRRCPHYAPTWTLRVTWNTLACWGWESAPEPFSTGSVYRPE